jgi:hypothetical protein
VNNIVVWSPRNLHRVLECFQYCADKLIWVDALCIYFNPSRTKNRKILRTRPLFSEGFHFASRIITLYFINSALASPYLFFVSICVSWAVSEQTWARLSKLFCPCHRAPNKSRAEVAYAPVDVIYSSFLPSSSSLLLDCSKRAEEGFIRSRFIF